MNFHDCMAELPLVAILRGVKPDEVLSHGQALVNAGFRIIEVPLNSPDPMASIAILQASLGSQALIGAGTVMTMEQVDQLADLGAKLMVCPHTDTSLIRYAKAKSLFALPGFFTATEAFAALDAGADGLKLFPAEGIPSPKVIKAMGAVLPKPLWFCPVGGVSPDNLAEYVAMGANGFGLGSALYKAGQEVSETTDKAAAFVAAWRNRHKGSL